MSWMPQRCEVLYMTVDSPVEATESDNDGLSSTDRYHTPEDRQRVLDHLSKHGGWSRVHAFRCSDIASCTGVERAQVPPPLLSAYANPIIDDSSDSDNDYGNGNAATAAAHAAMVAAADAEEAAVAAAAAEAGLSAGASQAQQHEIAILKAKLARGIRVCESTSASTDAALGLLHARRVFAWVVMLEERGAPPPCQLASSDITSSRRSLYGLLAGQESTVRLVFDPKKSLLHASTSSIILPGWAFAAVTSAAVCFPGLTPFCSEAPRLRQLLETLFGWETVAADSLPHAQYLEVVRRGRLMQYQGLRELALNGRGGGFASVAPLITAANNDADPLADLTFPAETRVMRALEQADLGNGRMQQGMDLLSTLLRFIYVRLQRAERVTTMRVQQRAPALKALDVVLSRLADRTKATVWYRALEDAYADSVLEGTKFMEHPIWALVPPPVARALRTVTSDFYANKAAQPRDEFVPYVSGNLVNEFGVFTLRPVPLTSVPGWASMGVTDA